MSIRNVFSRESASLTSGERVEFVDDRNIPVQEYRRSWDSDSQFSIQEIERIKLKTQKLRQQRDETKAQQDYSNNPWRMKRSHTWNSDAQSRRTVDSLAEVLDHNNSGTNEDSTTTTASHQSKPSSIAQQVQQALLQGFQQPRKQQVVHQDDRLNTTDPITEETSTSYSTATMDLQLHDLCGEASCIDDIAWRNALHLLSVEPQLASVQDPQGWTPLHVCCLGPAPDFILRALLFVSPQSVKVPDDGGRLPLHMVAASTANVETMQLLVKEYPAAVSQVDERGLTPLHLLLKNTQVTLTVARLCILLGCTNFQEDTTTTTTTTTQDDKHVLLRRQQHLQFTLEQIHAMRHKPKPVTMFYNHELQFGNYPPDVQQALRQLSKWKRRHFDSELMDAAEVNHNNDNQHDDNPASIPTPNAQLPIHMVVKRAIVENAALTNGSSDEQDDQEVSTTDHPSVPHPFDILRIIVASYPEGLVYRDSEGYTPLLLAMLKSEALPSLEVVELLLGKRTAGYNTLPEWAEELPHHALDAYFNPAMVPSPSQQLPLHVAAEELMSDFAMMQTLRDSYPGAIYVQDSSGRTPLHIALSSYRRLPVEPEVIALLYTDRVAQIRDDYGKLPFDYLVEGADYLPRQQPMTWTKTDSAAATNVYERLLTASIAGAARPSTQQDKNTLLRRLRSLPPWLRRQACASSYIQDLLVEDLATPWKCSLILLDGVLIIALITVFRLQMEEFIVARDAGDLLSTWYTFAVYAISVLRLVLEVAFFAVTMSFGEFQHLCLFNPFTWIDVVAMLLTVGTSIMLYSSPDEDRLFVLGSWTTGFLWMSLFGYLSTWWHGMSIFAGGLGKISKYLVWPFVVAGCLVVAFSQMFYTLLQLDCTNAIPASSVCSVRDAYRVVYMLLRGESLVSIGGYRRMSPDAVALVSFALLFFALFVVSLLVTILVAASRMDFESIALSFFWEPRLAFHVTRGDLGSSHNGSIEALSCWSRFSLKMEQLWQMLIISIMGGEARKRNHWYAAGPASSSKVFWSYGAVAIFVLPLWIAIGFLTLGWLWPPQLRRMLFRPWGVGGNSRTSAEQAHTQVSSMRLEMMQLKALSYERSVKVEKELRQLKDVLFSAMKEE